MKRTGCWSSLPTAHDSPGLAGALDRVLTDETLRINLIQEGLRASSRHTLECFVGQLVDELRILARQADRDRAPRPVHAS